MTGHPFLCNIAFALPHITYLGGHPERLRFLQYGDVFTRAYRTWDIDFEDFPLFLVVATQSYMEISDVLQENGYHEWELLKGSVKRVENSLVEYHAVFPSEQEPSRKAVKIFCITEGSVRRPM